MLLPQIGLNILFCGMFLQNVFTCWTLFTGPISILRSCLLSKVNLIQYRHLLVAEENLAWPRVILCESRVLFHLFQCKHLKCEYFYYLIWSIFCLQVYLISEFEGFESKWYGTRLICVEILIWFSVLRNLQLVPFLF